MLYDCLSPHMGEKMGWSPRYMKNFVKDPDPETSVPLQQRYNRIWSMEKQNPNREAVTIVRDPLQDNSQLCMATAVVP
jgi:hypothetical protein